MTISNVGQKGYFTSTSLSQSPSKGVMAWMPTRRVPGTRGCCRGCGGVLLTVLLLCRGCSTSQLLLFGIIILSHWHFQIAGTFCCYWLSLLPVASPGISSGTLVLTHGPQPRLPSTTPSIMAFYCNWGCAFTHGLFQCQVSATLHTPSCL